MMRFSRLRSPSLDDILVANGQAVDQDRQPIPAVTVEQLDVEREQKRNEVLVRARAEKAAIRAPSIAVRRAAGLSDFPAAKRLVME